MTRIKKLSLAFLLMGFNCELVSAQNLVVNPSFEVTASNCANFGGEGFTADLAGTWDSANSNMPGDSCSSPDLFSACNTLGGFATPTNMPNSTLGYQHSRTGTRHAGIITYEALGSQYREYIQGRTTAPLVAGQTYCVSMYVSLANQVTNATNNIGVYFTNTHYLRDACQASLINATPQLNYGCAPILDTAGWVRLQWDYVATGGEQYFTIGNFYNNAGTNVTGSGVTSFNPYAYYYIDDVSITASSCCYADIAPVTPLCITDAPVTLTAIPPLGSSCSPTPVTGTWSGPGMSASGTFTPATAGPGTHTITFTLSCGGTATTTIVVSPCIALAVCVETNGDLTASNGVAPYSWQSQTTAQDCSACLLGCALPPGCAVNVTNWTTFTTGTSIPAPATYPVQVVDNAGGSLIIASAASLPACTSSPCPTITVNVTAQTGVSCGSTNNGTATVAATGGTVPYQYLWTPGNLVGPTQTSLSAATYTVTVLDGANCTGSTTVTIGQATPLTLTMSSVAASCGLSNGSASVAVTGGSGTYTYAWTPGGATTASISNIAGGSYTVNVSDGAGCTGSQSVVVNSSASSITATVSTVGANCGATDGSATVTPSGGSGAYTYAWTPSGGTGATASGLASGAYSVLITDAGGCTLTQPVNVPALGGPTLAISNVTNATCGLSNGSATVTPSGGTSPYTYAWSPSGGTGATASGLGAGSYTVTVTDGTGCVVSDNATITGGSAIVVNGTVTDEDCGEIDGAISVIATGGSGTYTYAWTPGGGTSATLSGIPGDTYSVTVSDGAGCAATETFEVEVIGSLPVTVSPLTATIEQGDTVQLTATGGVTYTWTPITGLSCTTCADPLASPVITTTYEVTATDATGCAGTEEVTIFVNPICSKEIFVPTIFSPNGDGNNDQQCVLGNCIVELNFSIYNRWGEKVFETEDQNKCWDGFYKGKSVNSGVFVYKLKARLLNGTEIDQSGNINVVQ